MNSRDSDDLDEAIAQAVWAFDRAPSDPDLYERAGGLAHLLARAAHSLDGHVPSFLELPDNWDELRAVAADRSLQPLVLRALQAELARRYLMNTAGMAERCLELANTPVPGGPRSEHYVALLARSYIAGFHAETVIIAGSLLEDELADAFERTRVPLPATEAGGTSIYQQIETAHTLGWLTREARESAKAVWHRRCKLVHGDPTLVATAGNTVRATIAVLRELCVVGLQSDEEVIAQIKRLNVPPDLIKRLEDDLEARRRHKRAVRRDRPE